MFTAKRMFGSKLNVPTSGAGTVTTFSNTDFIVGTGAGTLTMPPSAASRTLMWDNGGCCTTTKAMTMAEYEQYTRGIEAAKKSEPPYFATGFVGGTGGVGSSGYATGRQMTATEIMERQTKERYRSMAIRH